MVQVSQIINKINVNKTTAMLFGAKQADDTTGLNIAIPNDHIELLQVPRYTPGL